MDYWSKVSVVDLGKAASAADVIYGALRDAIIRGEMPEGETLRQDNIAQIFNVSRIPVREALKLLESQGLATSVRYKGVVVASMSTREISEIFEFRALIEP
ncbi:MAG: GntR family transcriptional regulator, partial [Paralcaligenes sp.]